MPNKTPDALGSYLKEISRYPLLTAEEEIFYSQQVQKYLKLEEFKRSLLLKLKREATNLELAIFLDVNESEVLSYIEYIERKGKKAREWMILTNLRLVINIVKRHQGKNMEFLDLVQEGTLGLHQAVEKFDPSKGNRFSTYAYWWITQGITRAISQKSRCIHLPVHIVDKINKIRVVQQSLYYSLGRSPSLSEIAESSGLKPEKVEECLKLVGIPISLDRQIGTDAGKRKGLPLIEFMEAKGFSVEEQVDYEFLKDDVNKLLGFLTDKQRKILTLRFGLSSDNSSPETLTLFEVGDRLNSSPQRIRQIQFEAIAILQTKYEGVDMMRTHISG